MSPMAKMLSLRPTVKSGSLASNTVEVLGPTVVTRPTSPSPLMTVMSRLMPSRSPTSRVTVQENPWAAPIPTTWAALMPYCPAPAVLRSFSSSRTRESFRSESARRCLSSACSRSS